MWSIVFEKLIQLYTEQHCEQEQGGKTRLTQLAESALGRRVALISTAANDVTHSSPEAGIKQWLVKFHSELMAELSLEQPHNILAKTLIGCCERCPFCREQCELTNPTIRGKHSVSLHGPHCLGGWRWVGTGKMRVEMCNRCVASDSQFRYKEKDDTWQWKPYSKY